MNDTQLHLRWHSHSFTFTGMLYELHSGRSYTDVSLICDGGVVRAHRAVLSLCSPYLATVLSACSENDEAPLLLPEIPVQDIRYLISFIYRGQVDVPQQHIASFLNTGKHLHVLGLEQGDQLVESPYKSDTGSGSPSENEEDSSSTKSLGGNSAIGGNINGLGGNNNNIEKLDGLDTSLKMANGPGSFIRNCNIKLEDMKMENEPPEEGKIDLNFYLQQAIQSASMPCPLCKKEFKSQSGLRDHIRLHTGERPFVCDFCHMNFARASHLKRHRRMHTGEKPFECSVCGKDFSRGDKLKDHLRRHEAEDKLQQIRKQIQRLDGSLEESETGPVSSPSAAISMPTVTTFTSLNNQNMPLNSMSSLTSISPLTSMSQITNLSSITNLPPHMLLSKVNCSPKESPPAKRQCIMPKVPMLTLAHIPQGMGQVNSHLGSQSENIGSPMMGVTSIGECILRPIN